MTENLMVIAQQAVSVKVRAAFLETFDVVPDYSEGIVCFSGGVKFKYMGTSPFLNEHSWQFLAKLVSAKRNSDGGTTVHRFWCASFEDMLGFGLALYANDPQLFQAKPGGGWEMMDHD